MQRGISAGMAAGAVGTAALNVVTYLDMTVRGRAASEVPAQVAETLADRAGSDLAPDDHDEETAQNRSSGIGALLGYVTGLGIGAAYGLVRPHATGLPLPLAAVGLGAAAMAGSDVPATLLGVTEPRSWPATSWASDIIPHLAYGIATALAFDAIWEGRE